MSIIEQDNYILVDNKKEIEINYKKLEESKFGSNSNIYFYNETDVLKVLNKSDSVQKIIANTYNINSSKSLLLKYMNKIIFDQMEYTDGIDVYFKYLISLLENEVDKEINTVKDFRKCLTLTNFDS